MENVILKNQLIIAILIIIGTGQLFAQTDEVNVVLGTDTTLTVEPNVLRINQPNENTQVGVGVSSSHTGIQNTIFGRNAFTSNIDGSHNTVFGYGALKENTTGEFNTAIGWQSMEFNDVGYGNVALGINTLKNNSTGNRNVAVGNNNLRDNTTGIANIAVGWNTLLNNTTGTSNVGIGYQALLANTTGFRNIAIGLNALESNTAGSDNTAIGFGALLFNTEGIENVAIGKNAMRLNVTGNFNTSLGNFSMRDNTTGYQNVGLGFKALQNNTIGNNNVAVGQAALDKNTSGINNIGIGTRALYLNQTATENIAMGFEALRNNTNGSFNIALGGGAMLEHTTGSNNIVLGYDALAKDISGESNTAIGVNVLKAADGNLEYNVALGSEVMNFTKEAEFTTAIGHNAGGKDTTSLRNTYVGYASGSAIATSDDRNKTDNVMLGYRSGFNSDGSSNVFVGPRSGEDFSGSNKLFIENSIADSLNALIYGDFENDLIRLNGKVILRDGYTDSDGDTKIDLEKNLDDDKIRFLVQNQEVLSIEKNIYGNVSFHTPSNERNLFMGFQAGLSNGQDSTSANDGASNSAFGYHAMKDNTRGISNTSIGAYSLESNINGSSNMAAGWGALQYNTSGAVNSAFGTSALRSNDKGFNNSALGGNALGQNTQGSWNLGLGFRAGVFNTTGSNNVMVGANAGAGGSTVLDNHAKSNNVMVGYNSGQQSQGSNNVFLGYESGKNETGSNKLIIENTDADETSALIYGEFDNDYLRLNGQVDINGAYTLPTNMGSNGLVLHTNGAGAAFWATDENGIWEVSGDHAFYEDGRIGVQTASPSDALHVVGVGTEDLFRVQSGTNTRMRIFNNGSISLGSNNTSVGAGDVYVHNDLGIGVGNPSYKLHVSKFNSNNAITMIKNTSTNAVAGGLAIELGPFTNPSSTNRFIRLQDGNGTLIGSVTGNGSGGVQYNTTSDRRLKINIEEFENSLELIAKISPKVYERTSRPGKKEIGFIAQELYEVFPQVVSGTPDADIDHPMMVDYGQMTPLLVGALKEQQGQIEKLEAQLLKKDSDMKDLRAQVAEIRSMLGK